MNGVARLGATFIARGVAVMGGVVLTLLVGRLTGAEGLGQFAAFVSLLGVLSILSLRGQNTLLIRAVAWWHAEHGSEVSSGLLRFSLKRIAGLTAVLALAGGALLFSGVLSPALRSVAPVFLVALPLMAFLALIAGYAKGKGRPWAAPFYEIGGISLVASIILLVVLATGATLASGWLPWILTLSMVLLVIIAVRVEGLLRATTPPTEAVGELTRGEVDFTLIATATFLAQAGAFVLAAPFLSEQDLGLVRAAERFAIMVSFAVLVINPVISPGIVRSTRKGAKVEQRRLIGKALLAGVVVSSPILAVLLIAPEQVLGLMGVEFVEATGYLRALALVNFVIVLFGPSMVLLNMGGGERILMWISVAALIAAVTLYPSLSFLFGAEGFIMAYALIALGRGAAITTFAIRRLIRA